MDKTQQFSVIDDMPTLSAEERGEIERLALQAKGGDVLARAELFAKFRQQLHRLVTLRLDRRLQGRLDPSDVLQEAFITYSRRIEEYAEEQPEYFFVWLRTLTVQTMIDLHRVHLGAQKRDATHEVSLFRGALPEASSDSLAQHLLGHLTSPSNAAVRAELQVRLQEVLNSLDPIDREILTLRHFEELTNGEVAVALQLSKTAASNRYIRALDRLREALTGMPGFDDGKPAI